MTEKIPIIIPVYNTTPETIFLTVYHLRNYTNNPIIVVNDGSKRPETISTLSYISRKNLAEVLNKENGGKISALLYGLDYAKERYNPRCMFIMDDDVIVIPKANKNLDNILLEKCKKLNDIFPVEVYPVRDSIYILEKIIDNKSFQEDIGNLEEEIKKINPKYKISYDTKPNLLNNIQNIEHIVASEIARNAINEGGWVGGTASLWIISELERYLKKHSKEHTADDLELTLLLRKDGKGINYSDDIKLYAELISNLKGYIKQRTKWWNGTYRIFFKYPKEVLKNPLYTSYVLTSPILYALIFSPPEVKNLIGIIYPTFLLSQFLLISKKNLKDEVYRRFKNSIKLFGGLYISLGSLISSMIYRNIYGNDEVAKILEILGILGSLGYSIYILYKYKSKDDKEINLKDLLKYLPYVSAYIFIFPPMGFIDYVKKKLFRKNTKDIYKIANK